jgi:hypothetical protein
VALIRLVPDVRFGLPTFEIDGERYRALGAWKVAEHHRHVAHRAAVVDRVERSTRALCQRHRGRLAKPTR